MAIDLVVGVTALVLAALLLSPQMRRSRPWRATVTPLASIIGSGFLVSLPLLAEVAGPYAVVPMAGLIALSYLFGAAIRFNICHGEPLFEQWQRYRLINLFEWASRLALILAYVISVTYYLTLLAAFFLKGFGIVDAALARWVTLGLLAVLGLYGVLRGLGGLEWMEEIAVGLKLAVIAAILVGLLWLNLELVAAGRWAQALSAPPVDWHHVRIALGLLIVVQGFETSRFLASEYAPGLRVRTMRYAQIIAAVLYVLFFLLSIAVFDRTMLGGGVAAITDMVAVVAVIMPAMLTAGAIAAQLSAAIADTIGAGGLIGELSARRLKPQLGYGVTALVGIALTLSVDVYEVITIASKAFALYYLLQCLVAAAVLRRVETVRWRAARYMLYLALGGVALAVIVFGIPSEGGG